MGSPVVDEACVLVEGDWTHRFVHANGSRFHVVEAGTGPLVLLLHGFPEFWWAWHDQLTMLADAGFRAVAIDLRGYGATDKPPRGYDGFTLAADVVGLIRALGERDAVLVGAGAGGLVAWTTAAFHPRMVRRLVVLGAAHPLRLRSAIITDPRGQMAASAPLLKFQIPRYEHTLTKDDAAGIGELLRGWAGPQWLDTPSFAETDSRYREAMQIPQAMFCALEAYRWAFRSVLRLHGYRFVRQVRQPIVTPTLQLHGELDAASLPGTAQGSGRYVIAPYEWRMLDGVGHFPHLEEPDLVAGEIIRWAKS
ncbi:pimeloyl-ACP methyl ester carboxylesterase [Allocatelliglobosispora scoriae]|uniref:Pimeloyl-ACP methyl ester carboxylesterase n=1 Tax=Allocatelliglobosispora scoriae TaxID=643052 RepID=A0A841BWL0_9ACTN|nr:alpha/beta hydrolase [Allocatelliglobosispora scoriae]MBB5871303.1 pimeloyl-ACP methyl ester carboxylesterase [Allocatelliglobosispora scoriae]